MTARIAVLGLVLVTALLIDTVVLTSLSVSGVSPSLVVLAVAAVGLTDGGEAGARFGFAAGLAVDLLGGDLIGLSSLVYLLTGFGVGASRVLLAGPALLTQFLVGTAASAFAIAAYGALSLLLAPGGVAPGPVLTAAVVIGPVNGLLAPLVFRPMASLLRRVDVALPS